jgi:hypothetical protein
MEKTCKSCRENDCGLCDRTGRLVEDNDKCEKWTGNQTDWRTRMMQTFLAGHQGGRNGQKLYEVRNRSGDLILENATSGEIREELHCTTAQVNNARTSGDHIFGEYKVEEIDRKLSRKTDFDLLREFESVCDQLLGSRKGKK